MNRGWMDIGRVLDDGTQETGSGRIVVGGSACRLEAGLILDGFRTYCIG